MAKKRRGNGQGTLFKRNGQGSWIASWYDHKGKRLERSTRTTDKAAAERILSKRVTDTALRRDGVIDAHLDAICEESQRSIESQLNDFKAKMISTNGDQKHISTTIGYIQTIANSEGWIRVADINADSVYNYAATLKEGKNRSARTIQAYLTAIKGFSKWLATNNKLPRDPLISVSKPNPKGDRRRERRILLHDEWVWLQSVTRDLPDRYGMTGQSRVLLYAVAIQSGLRSAELSSLTRGKLFLGRNDPYIICKAAQTKNSKNAQQYIQCDLATELSEYVSSKAPMAPVFNMPVSTDVADMLRADLQIM